MPRDSLSMYPHRRVSILYGVYSSYLRYHRPSLFRLYIVLSPISIFIILLVGVGSYLLDVTGLAVASKPIDHLLILIELRQFLIFITLVTCFHRSIVPSFVKGRNHS